MSEYVLTDLDYAILGLLPDDGSRLGHHTLAPQVRQLVTTLNESTPQGAPRVTGALLNGRMRSMKAQGLVKTVVVTPVGGGCGWQLTKTGRAYLTELA